MADRGRGRAGAAPSRRWAALERLAARAAGAAPVPLGLSQLAPLRARLAGEIAARRGAEIARAQRLHLDGLARPGDGDGAAALAALATALVGELRREVADAGGAAWERALRRLDARLPTAAVEYMDVPSFSERRRERMIRALHRNNRAFGSYVRFFDLLSPLLAEGPATVLDLASGHGGFPLALAELAGDRAGVTVIASDVRPEYVEIGRRRALAAGTERVEFRVVDAFRLGDVLAPGEVDVITCTQSLHHFGAGGVAALIAAAVRCARRGILFVDLARSALLLAAVQAVAVVSNPDPAFLHDAAVSVRNAFVPEELQLIARIVPGGERLEAFYLSPGFVVLRSRPGGVVAGDGALEPP